MIKDPKKNAVEEGITNLGFVPDGMSFSEAIESIKSQRKFHVNPFEGGHRLTICDTIRMTLREVHKLPNTSEVEQIKEYLAQAYDFGKRMDARMKYLRKTLEDNGIDYVKGNSSVK